MRRLFLLVALSMYAACAGAQVPDSCMDAYCRMVRRLELGDTAIDYRAFRYSFLESPVFRDAKSNSAVLNERLLTAGRYWHLGDPGRVVSTLRDALRIDYTSMAAHSGIRRAFLALGDTASAQRHKAIEHGLLQSILGSGDGRSCASAWPVIQVEEEYFILEQLRVQIRKQDLVTKRGLCDRILTTEDGHPKSYYFEVTRVFDGYDK